MCPTFLEKHPCQWWIFYSYYELEKHLTITDYLVAPQNCNCMLWFFLNQQGQWKLLKNGCVIYIFASSLVNFWRIFKLHFSTENLSQLPICQKASAQLRTLRTQFRHPWLRYFVCIDFEWFKSDFQDFKILIVISMLGIIFTT